MCICVDSNFFFYFKKVNCKYLLLTPCFVFLNWKLQSPSFPVLYISSSLSNSSLLFIFIIAYFILYCVFNSVSLQTATAKIYKVKWKSLSHVRLFAIPWTTVQGILQAKILEWVAFPSLGDLPNPGIEPRSPACGQILYQLSHKGSLISGTCRGR